MSSDGSGGTWEAAFPFSFFVSESVESLRIAVDGSEPLARQRARLTQQWRLVSPLRIDAVAVETAGSVVTDDAGRGLPLPLLASYIFDFVQIHTPPVPTLNIAQRTQLVIATLTLAVPPGDAVSPPDTLIEVHLRAWNCETVLRAYMQLAAAVPACSEPLLALLSAEESPLSEATHASVLRCAFAALEPHRGEIGGTSYEDWMRELQAASAPMSVLLASCKPAARRAFDSSLEKLQLWNAFVGGVAQTLSVPQSSAAALWSAISSGDLRTATTFQAALAAMTGLLDPIALTEPQVSSFVQSLVLERLLGTTPTTDPALVRLLVLLFAGTAGELQTPLTACLTHQHELLRLILSQDAEVHEAGAAMLQKVICAEVRDRASLDGPLCASYVIALSIEDGYFPSEAAGTGEGLSPLLVCLQGLDPGTADVTADATVMAALHTAARCRRHLRWVYLATLDGVHNV